MDMAFARIPYKINQNSLRIGAYERIKLAGNDPSDGTPRGSEEKDIDTDEGDQGVLCGFVGCSSRNTDNGDNVLTNTHTGGTDEEEFTTTEIIDCPHTGESRDNIDDIGNDSNNEGVGNTGLGKECGSIVKDELEISKF